MTRASEGGTVLVAGLPPGDRKRYRRAAVDGYALRFAEDQEAVVSHLDDSVDVVVLAGGRPEPNPELVTALRTHPVDPRVAVVTDTKPNDDAADPRVDAYLERPVSPADLGRTVDRLLARSAYETELSTLYELCVQRANARPDGGVNTLDGTGATTDGEVDALDERIRELRDRVDDTVAGFETADFRASFRALSDGE